jgi:hypothetical protein
VGNEGADFLEAAFIQQLGDALPGRLFVFLVLGFDPFWTAALFDYFSLFIQFIQQSLVPITPGACILAVSHFGFDL